MNQLNNIIFQDINEEFSYGLYLGLNVVIMKSNGYVNATKLCNLANKEFRHWKKNQNAKELMEEVTRENSTGLEIVVNLGPSEVSGTYVHPDLIPHIASWCSAKFAIQVSKIVNEFAINEFKSQISVMEGRITEKSIEYVVPPQDQNKKHVFYITKESDTIYKMHRIQLKKYKPQENIIVLIQSPNSINLGVRLRERIKMRYNIFTLQNGMSEDQLINLVHQINVEKYNSFL